MNMKRTCPDCGVGIGKPHLDDCDVALCPFCEMQRITCECSELGESLWSGTWPTSNRDCTSPLSSRRSQQASGYDFEPLSDDRFLLEFYGKDGYTFAEAIMERSQMKSISEVIEVVLDYADEHGVRRASSSDEPGGYREWLAKRRRQEMGLE